MPLRGGSSTMWLRLRCGWCCELTLLLFIKEQVKSIDCTLRLRKNLYISITIKNNNKIERPKIFKKQTCF